MGWSLCITDRLYPGLHKEAAYHSVFNTADIEVLPDGEIELRRSGGKTGDFFVFEHALMLYPDDSCDTNDDPGFPPILRHSYVIDWLDEYFPMPLDCSEETYEKWVALDRSATQGEISFWRDKLDLIPESEKWSEEDMAALDRLKRPIREPDLLAFLGRAPAPNYSTSMPMGVAQPKIEASASEPKRDASDDPSGIVCSCVADIEAKPIHWLWRGRIARGKVTLIAGHPGLGKSQAILNFAGIVTAGGKWPLGNEHCERGSVVILSAEDDAADTIRPRLEVAGADISRVHIFEAVRDQDDKGETRTRGLNLATDITRIAAKIAELGEVALLIIDPVSAYLGETDSHKNADVRALLAPLADMASRHGVAVVLITHLAKNASAEALLRVQGSIAFAAAARAAWGVARDKDNPSRRLFLPLKNNIGSDQTGLAFAVEGVTLPGGIETSRVVWEREPVITSAEEAFAPDLNREDRTAVEEAKDFLAGLLADGPVSSRQVRADAEGAGHHWSAIRRAQTALGVEAVKEGLKGGWTWRLPPKTLA
jgi:KaiC/GvpD/RAD55 family RecA-like ATPase